MFGLQRWQVENTVKLIDDGNDNTFYCPYIEKRRTARSTIQVLRVALREARISAQP